MRTDRLLSIITILLNKGAATAHDLAARFEISTRTVYRDIEALCEAGVPIVTTKGKGGGIRLMEGYALDRMLLSDRDQQDIFTALDTLRAARQPGVDLVMEKVRSVFRAPLARDWLRVDFAPWSAGHREDEKFHALRNAILSKRRVSFDYTSYVGEKTHRIAEPVQLWFKSPAWYVIAWSTERRDFRTFKLVRLRNLAILEDVFDPALHVPLPALPPGEGEGCIFIPVTLRFTARCEARLLDEYDDELIERNLDGSFTVRIEYPLEDWVYGHFLSYGADLCVEEPEGVRVELARRIAQIQGFYPKVE